MNIKKLESKLLHYTTKAISEFSLIERGDKVMVCLSGGKDSFTLLHLLKILKIRSNHKFDIFSFTLDQGQPHWNSANIKQWLNDSEIPHMILSENTYSIVKDKIPEEQTYCSLCSRLRRGIIYKYAKTHGYQKIALGHHRDDLISTLLMSICFSGQIQSMPPKLQSDDKSNIVIRPLVYCQEKDIQQYALLKKFPVIPCGLCNSQENLSRVYINNLIRTMAKHNPKIPSNMLHALSSVKPSQLMDKKLWDFDDFKKIKDIKEHKSCSCSCDN